uniref:Uncharacterized protein n=1 Tax=Cacopsylla melanoneura TaxID=428564 RepID=A0A8D8PR33_9HEMI
MLMLQNILSSLRSSFEPAVYQTLYRSESESLSNVIDKRTLSLVQDLQSVPLLYYTNTCPQTSFSVKTLKGIFYTNPLEELSDFNEHSPCIVFNLQTSSEPFCFIRPTPTLYIV